MKLRKLVFDKKIHVFPSWPCFQERGEVEESLGLLELQCTFIWGENQKKFLRSSPVEALILFNEEHQGLLKLQVPLGWELGRME